jgi:hypothetical protein
MQFLKTLTSTLGNVLLLLVLIPMDWCRRILTPAHIR